MGGVGGYYGGLLAHHYSPVPEVEVYFLARGEHQKAIRQNGLHLVCHKGDFLVHPDQVTDRPAELGFCDLVIYCVKSYHLESVTNQVATNIGDKTVVLTLLNGINTADKLKALLPQSEVMKGFVYVNSHRMGPGEIHQRGIDPLLNFGPFDKQLAPVHKRIEQIFDNAGISVKLHEDIHPPMWEKFILVGSTASLTAFYGEGVREISKYPDFGQIVYEIYNLASAKGIALAGDLPEKLIHKIKNFKPGVKSSMQIDFESGRQTELELFTGYVVKESERLGLEAPFANKYYTALKQRLNG